MQVFHLLRLLTELSASFTVGWFPFFFSCILYVLFKDCKQLAQSISRLVLKLSVIGRGGNFHAPSAPQGVKNGGKMVPHYLTFWCRLYKVNVSFIMRHLTLWALLAN